MNEAARNRLGRATVIALSGLVAFAVYWVTLAPTVTGEDAGEFILAAWSLGIPHPPGYPLWTLLAHPFTWLPFGEVAFRVNLVSAVFAALSVALCAALILHLTRSRQAAIGASLAFAFSRAFWEQALFAEVYTLNAFCLGLCLYFVLRWEEERKNTWLWALALVFGLSLGAHNTMMVAGPVLAAYIFLRDPDRLRRLPVYAALTLAAFAAAALVYLYLPWRAAANPVMNWGDPSNLERFLAVVRRDQFAHMFTDGPRGLVRFVHQSGYMGRLWFFEFTWPAGLAAVIGLVLFLRQRTGFALLTLCLSLVIVGAAAYVQNFEFDREWLWVMNVFGIPAYFATALWLGVLLARLGARPLLQTLCAMAVAIAGLWQHWPVNDKSDFFWASDYARNLLEPLPEGAVVVAHQDHANFPALYHQAVDGLRPDVVVLRKYGYFDLTQLPEMPEEVRADFPFPPTVRDEPVVLQWVLEHTGRPLFVSRVGDRPPGPYRAVPAGLVHQVLRPGEAPALDAPLAKYAWRNGDPRQPHPNYTVALMGYELHRAEAERWLHLGEMEAGRRKVGEALAHFGEDPVVRNSLGVLLARHGLLQEAAVYFEEALALRPHFQEAVRNLDRARAALPSMAEETGDDPVPQPVGQ